MYEVPLVVPIVLKNLENGERMEVPSCAACGRGGAYAQPWSMLKWLTRTIIDDPAFGDPNFTTWRLAGELVDLVAQAERDCKAFLVPDETRERVLACGEPKARGVPNTIYIQLMPFFEAFRHAKRVES